MRAQAGSSPAAMRHAYFAPRSLGLLAGAVALTVGLAVVTVQRPGLGVLLMVMLVVFTALFLAWRRLARISVADVIAAGLISLPLLALLGPSFALPFAPQLFAYRIVLVLVAFLALTYLIVRPASLAFAASDAALPLALWFAWLCVGLLWAPEKLVAFNYVAIVATMVPLVIAAAAAGSTSPRLVAFGWTMVLAYVVIVGFTILEARFGVRLPTSRLLDANGSQAYAVTSVFHNQNDLATYIALCWPFMLCAFVFTRRPLYLLLSALCIALGAAAFVRTGSRSSLVAIALSTLAAPLLFSHLSARFSPRAVKVVGALIVLALAVGAGYLLFNNSDNDMLRQFRLESLLAQTQAGTGSGAIRTSLTERALELAGRTFLLGVGPGQAEVLIASGVRGLGISNLHNWWFETYVNGGLVGFGLHLVFFVGLFLALWQTARRHADPLVRYLAGGTALALLGFIVGALGPSSSVSFAPMWIMYGLGLAVISRARLSAVRETGQGPSPEAADGPASEPGHLPTKPGRS